MTGFPDADFTAVREYLRDQAGLEFDAARRAGLAAVVADRLRSSGAPSVPAYLASLAGESGAHERQRLLDAVTVQETHFFRNPPQMEVLRRRVLPELLRRAAGRDRPLTIWSAGCSTGEEPYTLAMLLLELAPGAGGRASARVVGTDVSAEALRAADRATYTGRSVDAMPTLVRDRWMERRPGGSLGVRDDVRRLVDLRLHNLVSDPAPFGPGEVDLVVCRNVTIYFGRDTTRLLMGRFHDVLAEGGYLLLGHSETLWQVSDAFTLVPVGDAFVYRRTHQTRRRSAPRLARKRRGTAQAPTPVAAPAPLPSDTDAALAALAAGDYPSAARHAQAALEADALLPTAYVALGQARTALGQDAGAVDPLRKAVYLDPAAGHAHFLLAGALARLGQHQAAAVSYRAAAQTLAKASPSAVAGLLDGRDVGELTALCEQLAEQSERVATAGSDIVASTPGGAS
jgi:chemotaxis protein methyltransferase CheR